MSVDKSKTGWLYPGDDKRRPEFRAAGAQHFIEIGTKVATWRDAVRKVRPGDNVFVWVLVKVPTRRGQDELPPVAQVREVIREIEARKGVLIEVYTGRKSSKAADKSAMIADAQRSLKTVGRRLMPPGLAPPGRRERKFTPEEWAKAEEVWCNVDKYLSWNFAKMHLPEGFEPSRAFRKWGSRQKANRDWLRRKARQT
jgi:hypothetical protein